MAQEDTALTVQTPHGPYRLIDDHKHEVVRALWDGGLTVREIAARVGTHPTNVSRAARRLGLAPRPRGRRPDPDTPGARAARLVIEGASPTEAAAAAGVTRQAVYNHLSRIRKVDRAQDKPRKIYVDNVTR